MTSDHQLLNLDFVESVYCRKINEESFEIHAETVEEIYTLELVDSIDAWDVFRYDLLKRLNTR